MKKLHLVHKIDRLGSYYYQVEDDGTRTVVELTMEVEDDRDLRNQEQTGFYPPYKVN